MTVNMNHLHSSFKKVMMRCFVLKLVIFLPKQVKQNQFYSPMIASSKVFRPQGRETFTDFGWQVLYYVPGQNWKVLETTQFIKGVHLLCNYPNDRRINIFPRSHPKYFHWHHIGYAVKVRWMEGSSVVKTPWQSTEQKYSFLFM